MTVKQIFKCVLRVFWMWVCRRTTSHLFYTVTGALIDMHRSTYAVAATYTPVIHMVSLRHENLVANMLTKQPAIHTSSLW